MHENLMKDEKMRMVDLLEEGEKRKFESLFQLYDLAWRQFNERRNHEFKVTLIYWTALAAAIAGSMTLAELPPILGGRILLGAIALFAVILHILWCAGLYNAQYGEKLTALSYQQALLKLVNTDISEEAEKHFKKRRENILLNHWSNIFQVGVTVFLAFTLVAANWNKFESTPNQTIRNLEKMKLNLENQKLDLESQKLKLEIQSIQKELQATTQPSEGSVTLDQSRSTARRNDRTGHTR